MINILNDLKEYCEDCPYMVLTHCESLGSGKLAYTCKYKRICEHCVEKITENKKRENIQELKDCADFLAEADKAESEDKDVFNT